MRKFLVTADQAVESVIEGILAVSRVPRERVQGHFGLIYRGNRHRRVHIVVGGGSGHEPLFLGAVGPGMADGAIAGAVFAAPNPFSIQATAESLRSIRRYHLSLSTIGMLARFGRATALGERVRTAQDPGATSIALFLESLATAAEKCAGKN